MAIGSGHVRASASPVAPLRNIFQVRIEGTTSEVFRGHDAVASRRIDEPVKGNYTVGSVRWTRPLGGGGMGGVRLLAIDGRRKHESVDANAFEDFGTT